LVVLSKVFYIDSKTIGRKNKKHKGKERTCREKAHTLLWRTKMEENRNREISDENKEYSEKTIPISRLIQRRIENRLDSEKKGFWDFFKS